MGHGTHCRPAEAPRGGSHELVHAVAHRGAGGRPRGVQRRQPRGCHGGREDDAPQHRRGRAAPARGRCPGRAADQRLLHGPHAAHALLGPAARAARGRLLDVPRHLRRVQGGALAGPLRPLCGRGGAGGTRHVRERALHGVGQVQPLREEAPVQGDASSVVIRYLLQLRQQRLGQPPPPLARARGQRRDERRDLARQRLGAADLLLQAPEQRLALVDAAHRVVAGRRHAVRGAVDVVGDDHPRVLGVALV
mmetsp:Transcript_18205/g.48037  ORF Transcript_18205/g.48037 Transcript_18205/m.48037 type:complete len:250 (-) Transcript_18205:924-1673(-)